MFLTHKSIVVFQSTQPEWAATYSRAVHIKERTDFNPRSPSGLRLHVDLNNFYASVFQSTQPEWAATPVPFLNRYSRSFQSTQPEWAATFRSHKLVGSVLNFNPRSPSGLRQKMNWALPLASEYFNPRSPSWLRQKSSENGSPGINFNPRSPSGLRPWWMISGGWLLHFNPRSPSGLRPIRHKDKNFFLLFQSTQPEWAATARCQ